MDWTSFAGNAGLLILGYLIVSAIVDRICRCKEHCATAEFICNIVSASKSGIEIEEIIECINIVKKQIKKLQ